MRRFFVIIFVLSSQLLMAQTAEDTLRKMEYEWLMAEFRCDTATISKMMDDRFVAIGSKLSSKRQELEGIYSVMSKRKQEQHIIDSLYFEDIWTRIDGNTAIISFISVTKGRIKDVPFSNRRTRMYDVWIRENGNWKAVSSQVTPLR